MASMIADIAAAVATELNSGTFSQAFEAEQKYLPVLDLPALKTLRVTVVPKQLLVQALSRDAQQHDISIDVAIQKRVDPADAAEVGALMQLVEEIATFFRQRRLAAVPLALWLRTENNPIYSVEHLDQHRVFTSVLTLTFKVIR